MTAMARLKEGYNATYSHICVNYFAENVEGDEAEYDGTELLRVESARPDIATDNIMQIHPA